MAEGHRMTAAREAVEEIMRAEHADVLRESVAWAVRKMMQVEVSAQVGAELFAVGCALLQLCVYVLQNRSEEHPGRKARCPLLGRPP
jgi:hypothetical protein